MIQAIYRPGMPKKAYVIQRQQEDRLGVFWSYVSHTLAQDNAVAEVKWYRENNPATVYRVVYFKMEEIDL